MTVLGSIMSKLKLLIAVLRAQLSIKCKSQRKAILSIAPISIKCRGVAYNVKTEPLSPACEGDTAIWTFLSIEWPGSKCQRRPSTSAIALEMCFYKRDSVSEV
ncbi:hypothetical protein JTE90_019959 [Oedothorax gibbosus]|uniref:Uncharacterized protein n=1 Tax=Oedothorax gibbosus TaxID=931172 RepID=A0AAV6UTJ9_9ARAC|nr:hypothetical protein JTE90_019959 [Oedothorax gibbosus]